MLTLIPIAGIAIGIGFLAWAVHVWRRGEATRQWPSVQGEITGVQVRQSYSSRDNDVTYDAAIVYRYSVRGKTFDGSRITAGGSPTQSTWSASPSHVRQYQQGMEVKVFHDPADPGNAVLQVGPQYPVLLLLLFLAAMFIGSSVAFWP